MLIRCAAIDDLDAIERLWKEMVVFHQKIDPYFTLNHEAETNHRTYMAGLIQDRTKRIFVADQSINLLGYLMAEVKAYPPIYVHKYFGSIGAISVTSTARRKGVGRKLFTTALEWFREQGLERIECGVAVENPVSQGFWKGMGFRGYMELNMLDI